MLSKEQAAQELLRRREARRDFRAWCILNDFSPAKHHELIIQKFQEVTDSPTPRYVIIEMPPGAAKSTYSSVLAPAWYLGRRPGSTVLACSYSKDLAVSFGRKGRNYVEERHTVLGYDLRQDTKAADEWETSNGGRYFCAGVGAGIAGHRCDLGLIDDPLGSQEDADSKHVRDKQWDWFKGDFHPRLKPNASIFIIANRRHEDDLIGRLLRKGTDDFPNDSPIPPEDWEVIRLPYFAEKDDVLGRELGERLWPEWYTEKHAEGIKRLNPKIRAGLWQQRPAPEEGDFFLNEWLQGYTLDQLPKELKIYAASDHAVSKRDDSCPTCMGAAAVSSNGNLYIMPQIFWKRADTDLQIEQMLFLNKLWKPIWWLAEKEHITQSIGPFLKLRMKQTSNWIPIREVVPRKDKVLRAQSFRGLCSNGQVFFPKFTDWWPEAENQLLTFPNSSESDFVDMLGHIGKFVDLIHKPEKVQEEEEKDINELSSIFPPITLSWVKKSANQRQKSLSYEAS